MHKVRVGAKFYLGQNEDCSPGDSISALRNWSKEVGGGVSIYVTLVKGARAVKHTCWQRLAASHEEQMSPLMILVLF